MTSSLRSVGAVMILTAVLTTISHSPASAGGLSDRTALRARLQALADAHPGRVGVCAQDAAGPPVCVNGDARFSLQSVMKLVVGVAAMRAVDEGRMRLDDPVTVRREDLSVNIQPIADIVNKEGVFQTTIGDLVRRAVVESDSAATDLLIERLGGVGAVQVLLVQAGVTGIRIDRTERQLQTETTGLAWDPAFVFPERLDAARTAVSEARRADAFRAYLADERDTATPSGMTAFLHALAAGRLLSPVSTRHFLQVMAETVTFPDRLRAGVPQGWIVGHKTGTSQTLGGVNGVTNDVGVLTAPDGGLVAVAAFVAESRAPARERARVIADAARVIVGAYR